MIVFRQVDARYPFLWEGSRQPEGRWHAALAYNAEVQSTSGALFDPL